MASESDQEAERESASEAASAPRSSHRRADSLRGPVVLSVVALLVAAAALGLAGWLWFHPRSATSAPAYTDAQRADAKAKVCTAYDTVRTGVTKNTNLQPPGGDADIVGALAVAANARISLNDGGQYLLARLDPATPADLTDAVRKFANGLMDIGAAATAGIQNTDPAQAARLKNADAVNRTVDGLCK